MTQHEGHRQNLHRKEINRIIARRLRALERQQTNHTSLLPESFQACQDDILEDVLERTNGCLDKDSVLQVIDVFILENKAFKRTYQDRSLKSFFTLRLRVLRVIKWLFVRYLNPKGWLRRRRK